MPALGQAYFVASTKTTETFELKEGRTIEYRVDLVGGLNDDSYAVLAFIPTATGANSLGGYGIAKSPTDVLITKGIGNYFIDDDTGRVDNENVVLVLRLTARGGNVYIKGQVLDKEDGNKVIWERNFVDTPAADVFSDGSDTPPAPFITSGNVVLYLYADEGTDPGGYQVTYDNLEVFEMDTAVLDDFNAAERQGWTDSNPINLPLPGGQQAGGQFTFGLPALGQAYFVASTKTTKTYELAEGTRHEFRVDLVGAQGPDSYAVLAFIPTATGANTLAGYGIAKSETDILITKGIGNYFIDDDTEPRKNSNMALVLSLLTRGGNVYITGQVLDKDDGEAVIWERTFVDTSAADIFSDGSDTPPAPFITSGNVVLYLYADEGTDPSGYAVVYDNLWASAPPAVGNEAPIIGDVSPLKGANFLAAPAQLSFKASDDKPLPDEGIKVTMNGTVYTTANGLQLSGSTTSRTATLGGLAAEQVYNAVLSVTDADGVTREALWWFDTLTAAAKVVEVEDYNFESGGFFNNPVRTPEYSGGENSFTDRIGTSGVDYSDTRANPNGTDTMYRTWDPVRMQHSIDLQRPVFDNAQFVYDYDVGDVAAGEWLNYTRTFTTGSYEVYLREAVVNLTASESVLELVTSDPTQPGQTVSVLGSFFGDSTGYTFRNNPLTDGTGLNKVVLNLSGTKTFRLRQVTADGGGGNRYFNYLVFVPVAGGGKQRATVSSVSPANNAVYHSVQPMVTATILNRETTVNVGTVVLRVNDAPVGATVTPTADGASVSYALSPLPAPNSVINCQVTFQDSDGEEVVASWSFTLAYHRLDPANARPGPGVTRGFRGRMVQAPLGSNLDNDLARAEEQLRPNSSIPALIDANFSVSVVNQTQNDQPAGHFTAANGYPDAVVPGLDEFMNGTDDFVVEVQAWLQLSAGIHRFGVMSDDGYKVSSGATPGSKEPIVAFHNGGPADETFDFVAPADGFYPFRMIWYERGGGAHGEWFSVNLTTGERTLINDSTKPGAVLAFEDATAAPPVQLESSAAVNAGYAVDASANVNLGTKTITVNASGEARFYRLQGVTARIKSISVSGSVVTLIYE